MSDIQMRSPSGAIYDDNRYKESDRKLDLELILRKRRKSRFVPNPSARKTVYGQTERGSDGNSANVLAN